MKILLSIAFVLSFSTALSQSLEQVRVMYFYVAAGEAEISDLLEATKDNDDVIIKGYYGAVLAMSAEETSNPLSKLKRFNEGKGIIESCIEERPQSIDLRFLRYALQRETPSFLGYSEDLEKDKTFLEQNIDKESDMTFRENVKAYLKQKN